MMNKPQITELVKFGTIIYADRPEISIPLKLTQVNAHLTGLLASVSISQHFENPLDQTAELIYLFPLPQQAALIDFKIMIGSRTIQADLREREQALGLYQQALGNGQHAALIDQLRPNLISLRLANVRQAEFIQTKLQYEERLILSAEGIEFVFPMGLTPKYQSPDEPEENFALNPPYAKKGALFGAVEIQVIADLGFSIASPICPSHAISVDIQSERVQHIQLVGQNRPDHDFVLRFPYSSQPVEMAVWCGQDASGEVILANWLPGRPEETGESSAPREFVFVLDRSGSMSGEPIAQARNALRACLRILEPQDTFRILLFDHELEWFQPEALPVTQSSVQQADSFLYQIDGRGGTEIIPALEAVLNLPASSNRTRYILFLTDGAVSAENQALNVVRQKLKNGRIFTFGIGPSVNRALLAKMAEFGRGSAEFLQLDEDIEGAILRLQDKIAFPLLTDIQLDWKNCQVWDVYPTQLPDLYAGQSLQLSARLKRESQSANATVIITGRIGKRPVLYEMPLPAIDLEFHEASRLWARTRIDDLLDQDASGLTSTHSLRQEIIGLAIEHRLLTPYSAFVALDSEIINPTGQMIPIEVSQPLPKGLDWARFRPSIHQALPPAYAPSAVPIRLSKMMMESPAPKADETSGGNLSATISSQLSRKTSKQPLIPDQSLHTGNMHDSVAPDLDTTESTLRWLARTQQLDGSWNQGIEFTAAALLAFVRNGQTIRKGYYRKQVKRAAAWLSTVAAVADEAFAQVLGLTELGNMDQDEYWQNLSQKLFSTLPAPGTPFQSAVIQHILTPNENKGPIHSPTNLETIRLAAVLGSSHPVNSALLSTVPSGLLKVWSCAISSTN